MPSTYSTSLRLELPGDGEQSGTWGQTANRNFGTLLEAAIAGVVTVTHNDAANYNLTVQNGVTDESRQMVLNVTGTLTAQRNVVAPAVPKLYSVRNSTSGGFSIVIKTSGGSGFTIPNGQAALVYCNGTDFFAASEFLGTLNNDLLIAGTGRRIRGDLSNATRSNRLMIQNSTAAASSTFAVIPSAGGVASTFVAYELPDPDNSSGIYIQANATASVLGVNANGSGTVRPFQLQIGGLPALAVSTGRVATFLPSTAPGVEVNSDAGINAELRLRGGTGVTTGLSLVSEQTSSDAYVIQRDNAFLRFRTNNTERYSISGAGAHTFSAPTSGNTALTINLLSQNATSSVVISQPNSGGSAWGYLKLQNDVSDDAGILSASSTNVGVSGAGSSIGLYNNRSGGSTYLAAGGQARLVANSAGTVTVRTVSSGSESSLVVENAGNYNYGTVARFRTTGVGTDPARINFESNYAGPTTKYWAIGGEFGIPSAFAVVEDATTVNQGTTRFRISAGGAAVFSNTVTAAGAEIKVGTAEAEEKRLRMTNNVRDVYFYLNGTQSGMYDVTGGFSRFYTDASGNMVVYAGLSVNNGTNGVWHSGNFTPASKASLAAAVQFDDITTYRAGAPTTGVIYLGNSGARYLYYDGSQYVMPGASLNVNGSTVWTQGNLTNNNQLSNGSGYITTAVGSWTGNTSFTGSAGIAMSLFGSGANAALLARGGTGQDVAIFDSTTTDAIVKITGNSTTNAYLIMGNGSSGERARLYCDNSRNFVLSTNSGTTSSLLINSSHHVTAAGQLRGNGGSKGYGAITTTTTSGTPTGGTDGDFVFVY